MIEKQTVDSRCVGMSRGDAAGGGRERQSFGVQVDVAQFRCAGGDDLGGTGRRVRRQRQQSGLSGGDDRPGRVLGVWFVDKYFEVTHNYFLL
ncbi:MAG: hypothetical protein HGA80_07710 [Candidatus Omnitrophica bacterium]|nr:hypothetical protein [Candidatus Omnitrophota bacterium]